MNRLKNNYSILSGKWNDYYYSENFDYDKHGNITTLTRWDHRDIMDLLRVTYQGNQVIAVKNTYGVPSSTYDCKRYHDTNDSGDDFAYDANGNIRYDKDRGIAAIRYNLLNLPDTIQFSNGNQIIHTYDAAGNRLRTSYYTRKVTTIVPLGNTLPVGTTANYYTTHDIFHCNCVYHVPSVTSTDYAIEFVHNSEGYIRYLTRAEHYHFYYIKDHLGNVRETYVHPAANYKECIQRMQYYPSGLPWNTNFVANEQPYKYGGKEFVEMHGLDEYDSHARWYYPALARTTTMDPHSEDYYPISPYAWCGNNFVNVTDPTGMDWYQNDSTQNYIWFKETNEIDGYVHIGGAGCVLGEFEPLIDRLLTNVYHTDGLYTDGRSFGISSIDKGALIRPKGISGTFLDEFVFNEGPEVSVLLSNHPYTRQMMDDPFVKSSQYSMRKGNLTHFSDTRAWTPFSVLNPQNWKMAPQFIGSYRYDIYASSNTSLLNNIVSDSKSLRSLFYHIVPEKYNRSREQSNHFGNTYQFYIWQTQK